MHNEVGGRPEKLWDKARKTVCKFGIKKKFANFLNILDTRRNSENKFVLENFRITCKKRNAQSSPNLFLVFINLL